MCEAPLSRNATVISCGMSHLSPVRRALTIAFVLRSVNGTASAISCIFIPMLQPRRSAGSMALIQSSFPHSPQNPPRSKARNAIAVQECDILRPAGCMTRLNAAETAVSETDAFMIWMSYDDPAYVASATPAAKGNENPAISLSTFISYLFFAKVAIIFITLQRCGGISLKFQPEPEKYN